MKPRWGALALVALGGACGTRATRQSSSTAAVAPSAGVPRAWPSAVNASPFAPSFVKLQATDPVDAAALGDPVQCASCHADVVAQWEPSAHHNSSFTNRFYAMAVDLTRKHRGNKVSRWCAGCHDPSLMLAGATSASVAPIIDADDVQKSPRAGDGIGCLVCHSVAAGSRLGGGAYTVQWKGFREPDPKVPAEVEAHKQAMKPAALSGAELCASCHKVSLHADVNGKKWLRGQNDFDAWEQGPWAYGGGKSAGAVYAPDTPRRLCQDCHMQDEAAVRGDLAARPGQGGAKVVRSHRFLAANTAIAAFAGDVDTVARQQARLAGAVRVDVVALRRAGRAHDALPIETTSLVAGEQVVVDVVVENTNVGHRFPTGTVDSNEVWLALDVLDAKGRVVAQSGALDAKGELGAEAHRFGVLQLDKTGTPALLRDAHRFVAAGWDTTVPPKDARVGRFALTVPDDAALPLRVRARVLYRKFSRAFAEAACASTAASAPPMKACPPLPITEVARDEVVVGAEVGPRVERWRRLDAYARGLLAAVQEEVGDAEPILAEVQRLAPERAHGPIDLARLRIRQGRTADADAALDLAARLDPDTPVVPFLRGVARYEIYRLGEAVAPLSLAVARAPHAVHAVELLGEALQLQGDDRGSLAVVHAGLAVDPESAQLRHLEALAFDKLGLPADASIARAAYLDYRRDDDTPALRALCRAKVPGCAREANPLHVHLLFSP